MVILWRSLPTAFEKKTPNPSPNKCRHCIYCIRFKFMCFSARTPGGNLLGSDSCWFHYPPIQVSHNGPRSWLCNGMLGALHVQGCLASGSLPEHCLDPVYSLTALSRWRPSRLEFSLRGAGGIYKFFLRCGDLSWTLSDISKLLDSICISRCEGTLS